VNRETYSESPHGLPILFILSSILLFAWNAMVGTHKWSPGARISVLAAGLLLLAWVMLGVFRRRRELVLVATLGGLAPLVRLALEGPSRLQNYLREYGSAAWLTLVVNVALGAVIVLAGWQLLKKARPEQGVQ
jgi:hypothetical protein